jgi:hypothetical protein
LDSLGKFLFFHSGFLFRDEKMTVSGFVFLGAMEAFIFVPLMPILIENLALVMATDAKTSRQ